MRTSSQHHDPRHKARYRPDPLRRVSLALSAAAAATAFTILALNLSAPEVTSCPAQVQVAARVEHHPILHAIRIGMLGVALGSHLHGDLPPASRPCLVPPTTEPIPLPGMTGDWEVPGYQVPSHAIMVIYIPQTASYQVFMCRNGTLVHQ